MKKITYKLRLTKENGFDQRTIQEVEQFFIECKISDDDNMSKSAEIAIARSLIREMERAVDNKFKKSEPTLSEAMERVKKEGYKIIKEV